MKQILKDEVLCIRCYRRTRTRFKVDFVLSESRDYEYFLNRLLEIYEVLMKKYGVKKIDLILDYLGGTAIVVRGQ